MIAASVLSGNRNFEGRVHPEVKMNFLASPPLVVAYALAGSMTIDLTTEPLATGSDGKPVYLKDIWPTPAEIQEFIAKSVDSAMFKKSYASVFAGDENWNAIRLPSGKIYAWDEKSTYVKNPPYFVGMTMKPGAVTDVRGARVLAHPRRLRHHGPHLARRRYFQDQPGGEIPRVARCAAEGLQLLRRTSWQP